MKNCGTCKHWKPPTERGNYGNVVRFRDDEYVGDYDLDYKRGDAEDKKFGFCKSIKMGGDLPLDKPTPLAVTMDGSQYMADLFTQAEFGCVLWAEKDERSVRLTYAGEPFHVTKAEHAELAGLAYSDPVLANTKAKEYLEREGTSNVM